MNTDVDSDARALAESLSRRFPRFSPVTIERLIRRTYDQFRNAPVQTFVPILVRRSVEAQLRYVDETPPAMIVLDAGPVSQPASR